MEILIVSTYDIQGGAGRAAYRLHQILLDLKLNSKMLVQDKLGDDFTVIGPTNNKEKVLSKLNLYLNKLPLRKYKNKSKTLFSNSNRINIISIVDKINKLNPSIVHLHWTSHGMLSIEDIAKIKAPIVWSLHDMYAFTGGCHYDEGCNLYKSVCGNCKVLRSSDAYDLSFRLFKRKQNSFNKIKSLTIVCPSNWMAECVKESALLKDRKVQVIPNPIDLKIFKPIGKKVAREMFNLPQDKRLILFGAMEATLDPRKGFNELKEALKLLKLTGIELVILGSTEPQLKPDFPFTVHYLGKASDDVTLNVIYNACDVMIVPSIQENLSNTIMESLSCTTPVVAFNIGGNKDLVDHEVNGYLSEAYNPQDLATGITWVLQNPQYDQLSTNARKKVETQFEQHKVAEIYIELYKSLAVNTLNNVD